MKRVGRAGKWSKTGWDQAFQIFRALVTVIIAVVFSAIIVALVSDVPGEALFLFFTGPIDSLRHIGNVVELMIPLLFTGLAVSLMFSASQFNLGTEGAFFFGAIAATWVSVNFTFPAGVHSLLAIFSGGIAGAILCGLPGWLKVKWGASEMVSSLMFNYIAFYLGLYLVNYFMRDVNAGAMVSHTLTGSSRLVKVLAGTRLHAGVFIAAFSIFLVWIFLYKTRWGYRIQVVGKNIVFARYSGINTNQTIVLSQLIGGGLAGIGGAVELLGMYRRFSWQILPGYGWSGIIVAILARNNPAYVPAAAFFLAYLTIGADIMSRYTDVPNEFVAIVQGMIIILVAAENFLANYKHRIISRWALELERSVAVEEDE